MPWPAWCVPWEPLERQNGPQQQHKCVQCCRAEGCGLSGAPFMSKCVFYRITKEFQNPERACKCLAARTGRFCTSWALVVSPGKGEPMEFGPGHVQPWVLSRSQRCHESPILPFSSSTEVLMSQKERSKKLLFDFRQIVIRIL